MRVFELSAPCQVESMLQHPYDPDAADRDGVTALMMASESGHVELVALLLEAGALNPKP